MMRCSGVRADDKITNIITEDAVDSLIQATALQTTHKVLQFRVSLEIRTDPERSRTFKWITATLRQFS